MALGNIFDIAGTGMNAQSLRLNTTASNLANAQSASSSVNEVYRSRQPVFAAIQQQAMRDSVAEGTYSDNEVDAAAGVQVLLRAMRPCNAVMNRIIPKRMSKVMCTTRM